MHAAGTLDDRPFAEMDEEAVRRVATPKVSGAANLHEFTADNKDIEFFFAFSSIATMTGNTRQANYCLANSYMDSLVRHRLASGLPGNSINLVPVAEAGMAAGNDDTARYLELMGLFMTSTTQKTAERTGILSYPVLLAIVGTKRNLVQSSRSRAASRYSSR